MFSLYMAERLWRYWNSLDIPKKDIMTISAAMERDIAVFAEQDENNNPILRIQRRLQ